VSSKGGHATTGEVIEEAGVFYTEKCTEKKDEVF